jgi:Papain-like cysteine protease AvrRpt2
MDKLLFIGWFLLKIVMPTAAQGEIYQLGNANNYCAGDYYNEVETYKARQSYDNWCWAACIQMVLKKQGLYIDQCDIVMQGFGQSECKNQGADCATIETAASGWTIQDKAIKAYMDNQPTAHGLINDLAFKYPLVIGLDMPNQNIGHAYVLTAIYFRYDPNHQKIPYKVILRDPWPSNPSRKELAWSDFAQRINCITHVTF